VTRMLPGGRLPSYERSLAFFRYRMALDKGLGMTVNEFGYMLQWSVVDMLSIN